MIMKMLLLTLAGHKYSSSVEHVRHILTDQTVFPLVCLRRGVIGSMIYEDKPIPVLDPIQVLDLEKPKIETGGEYLIVFQTEYGEVGLPVDSAVTIVDVEDGIFENIARSDSEHQGDPIFCYQDASYKLLDMNSILAHLTD